MDWKVVVSVFVPAVVAIAGWFVANRINALPEKGDGKKTGKRGRRKLNWLSL
jgi:hypothetical protein